MRTMRFAANSSFLISCRPSLAHHAKIGHKLSAGARRWEEERGTVEGKRETDGVNGQKKTERKEFSVSQLLCRVYGDVGGSTRTL